MVIQELPLQDANQTSPYTAEASPVFIPEAGFTPTHPDGVRLTAYHCVHPFVTRQFYATSENPLAFTEC